MFQPAKKYVMLNAIYNGKMVQMSIPEATHQKMIKLTQWSKLHWIVRFWLKLFGKKKEFLKCLKY